MNVVNSRLKVIAATSHPHVHTSNFSNGIGWVLQVLFSEKIPDARGCWQSAEKCLLDHTGIQFSGRRCPGCLRRLYLEMADEALT